MSNAKDKQKTAEAKEQITGINEPRRRLEDRFDELHNIMQADLKQKSEREAFKAIHEIQEKVLKWADSQLKILKMAVSIVLVALTAMGLGGYWKYDEITSKLDTRYVNFESKLDIASELVNSKIKETQEKLKKFNEDLNDQVKNAKDLVKELNAKENLAAIKKIQDSIDELSTLKNSLKSISRSVIKLTLHYKTKDFSASSKDLENISSSLFKRGFVLSPEQVLNLHSNRSEIIYYSPITKSAAEEIKDSLQEFYSNIKTKMEPSDIPEAPNRIIIKIDPTSKIKS